MDISEIPVITIDGPSGTGKGTVASGLAQRLGFHLLDSGSLYRVLGIAVARTEIDLTDHDAIADLARNLDIQFGLQGPGSVALAGEDISLEIRTDLGSDIDDTWALAMILGSPELDLKLITTANGDTEAVAEHEAAIADLEKTGVAVWASNFFRQEAAKKKAVPL